MPSVNWREMEIFRYVDLEDSFILRWERSDTSFTLWLEFSLWPGHAAYQTPLQNEYTCYKRGRLTFPHVTMLGGLIPMKCARRTQDTDGSFDYGSIDNLMMGEGGRVHLSGEFGNVILSGGVPLLEFED